MSKTDKNLASFAALSIGGVLLIGWLQSNPNCDKGCRTQLEHIKDHLMVDLAKTLMAQFGL
jgi:hypothetical protein